MPNDPSDPFRHYQALRFDLTRMFPDYSKLMASMIPDYSRLTAALIPDHSKLMQNLIPDYSKLLADLVPDYSKLPLSIIPDYSKMVQALTPATAFPDYSKIFSSINTAELFRNYRLAMPAAAHAAEDFVVDDVLPEVAPDVEIPSAEVADWIRALPPAKRRELGLKISGAIGSVLTLATAALAGNMLVLGGALLALATSLFAIYHFILSELERNGKNGSS